MNTSCAATIDGISQKKTLAFDADHQNVWYVWQTAIVGIATDGRYYFETLGGPNVKKL